MIKQLYDFLGPTRARALFLLLALTGLASLILNAVQAEWARAAQTMLALTFVVGAAGIIITQLPREARRRWLAIVTPAIVALFIGLLLPQAFLLMFGLALGWIIAGVFLFRARAPMQYQKAVKLLRKNQYAEAVKAMDDLIKAEPDKAQHYDFRARLLRVWGKIDRAKRDYRKVVELAPDNVAGYNALSEVYLQTGDYTAAQEAAQKAVELAPKQWVAYYNLGMIEDRLAESEAVIAHLRHALSLGVKDARHRVLMHFYLARAHSRMGNLEAAAHETDALKKLRGGLQDWHKLLASDQAETLRAILGADIQAAQALADGARDLDSLARERSR